MSSKNYQKLTDNELDYIDDKTAALLLNTPSSARLLLWIMVLFFIAAIAWAGWAQIDKVTVGQGKVIPSSQLQIVQNLEGGLVKRLLVKEGEMVEEGQQLILIDDTRFRSDFREREQQVANLTASVLQLSASITSVVVMENFDNSNWQESVKINSSKLAFPPVLSGGATRSSKTTVCRVQTRPRELKQSGIRFGATGEPETTRAGGTKSKSEKPKDQL